MSKVNCPKCSTTLRVPDDLPAGKRVRCPRCETKFLKPADAGDEPGRPSRRRESSRDDDDRGDDAPRRPRSKGRRPQKKSNAPIIAGAVLAVVLLLVGGAVAGYFLWPDKKDEAVANVPAANGNPNEPVKMAVGPGKAAPGKANVAPGKGGNGVVGLDVGNLAMEIDGEDIDGQSFKLSDYRGKVVLLDFWGHW